MYKLQIFSIVVILSFAGCAASLGLTTPSRQTFTDYKIDQPKEVSIGEPLVEVERASTLDAYEAQFGCQTPSIGIQGTEMIYVRKGDRFTAVALVSGSPDERLIRQEGLEKKSIFISIFRDGRIKRGWILSNGISPVQGRWPTQQLFIKSDIPSRAENSFKAQLIYSGVSGSTLKLAYREFADDYARAAFSQDLQYDLNESKTVAFKSLRIEILKATNSTVQYVVKSDGGLPWLPR